MSDVRDLIMIMLTRLGGVISKDGDNEKGEDKWRHNDVCMETQIGTDCPTGEKMDFIRIISEAKCSVVIQGV